MDSLGANIGAVHGKAQSPVSEAHNTSFRFSFLDLLAPLAQLI